MATSFKLVPLDDEPAAVTETQPVSAPVSALRLVPLDDEPTPPAPRSALAKTDSQPLSPEPRPISALERTQARMDAVMSELEPLEPAATPRRSHGATGSWADEPEQEPWSETLSNIPTQVRSLAARTIAGMKLQALEELQAVDPSVERQQRIDQERAVIHEASQDAAATKDKPQSLLQKGVQGAASSLTVAGPTLVAGILTRNPAIATATMYPTTEGQSYGEFREKGLSPEAAAKHSAVQGLIEVGTETLPAVTLFRHGTPAFKRLTGFLAAELPGESVATIGQTLDEHIAQLPGDVTAQDFVDGLKLGIEQLPETWATTIIAGGAQSGIASLADAGSKQQMDLDRADAELKEIEDGSLSDQELDQRIRDLEGQAGETLTTTPETPAPPPETAEEDVDPFAAPTVEQRLKNDTDLRSTLESMALNVGWEQEGGKLLRKSNDFDDPDYNVITGRTQWIPRVDWWPERPQGFNEQRTREVIKKALGNESLAKDERRYVEFLVGAADEQKRLTEYVPEWNELPNESRDNWDDAYETAMVARAAEIDGATVERLAVQHEDDHNAFLRSIKGFLDGYDHEAADAQRQAGQPASQDEAAADFELEADVDTRAQAEPPRQSKVAARAPRQAGPDLFGEDTSSRQALADEIQRRDQRRNAGQDSVETGDPADLFSQARRQTDLVDTAAHEAATSPNNDLPEPTPAQIQAGNYRKGRIKVHGLDISIENPKGSVRRSKPDAPVKWQRTMTAHYGYVRASEGADGEHVDVFVGKHPTSDKVFVIDQVIDGKFDEHKVVMGEDSIESAKALYQANYQKGWDGLGAITPMSINDFKQWVKSPGAKQPIAWKPKSHARAPDRSTSDRDETAKKTANTTIEPVGQDQQSLRSETDATRRRLAELAEDLEPKRAKIAEAVRAQLVGVKGAPKVTVLPSVYQIPKDVQKRYPQQFQKLSQRVARGIEGQYNPENGEVFIFADVVKTPERAKWVLFHELAGHHGTREAARKMGMPLDAILNRAWANSTVNALAKEIAKRRNIASWRIAADESLAELAAAVRTGNYDHIHKRYGVKVPQAQRTTLRGLIERLIERIKQALAKAFHVKRGTFSDADVYDLLETGWGEIQRGKRQVGQGNAGEALASEATAQPIFYSALTRAAVNAKINKGTPEQWLATLRNTQGVKGEELNWSGIEDWLKEQPSVSKQQVVDYLRANEIQVTEVVHGGQSSGLAQQEHDRLVVELTALGYTPDSPHDTEHIAMEGPGDSRWVFDSDAETWVNTSDESQSLPVQVRDRADKLAEIRTLMDDAGAAMGAPDDETRYQRYTTPGGSNYRELLLTLPPKRQELSARRKELAALPGSEMTPELRREYEHLVRLDDENAPSTFRSSHWSESNVLAHVRFDERTDADGKRVMHIAEVQSDWHQVGRKRGYIGTPRTEAQILSRAASVPDAPFKTTWPELAMKRAIRYAAENGFDRISWDTGQTNADRYDLSKQIKIIRATRTAQGAYHIEARGHNNALALDDVYQAETLPDVVGKELAERIANQGAGLQVYSGLDLKVGGEGMVGFYDKILPATVNKYIKKWGGKVERTSVKTGYGTMHTADAHGVDITPAMRESALQGQPLFSRSDATQKAYERRIDELFEGAKANRIGVRILDKSDVLGLLGYPNKPVLLAEGKVIAGQDNHPNVTADIWKKIPQWLDNPAAVFNSDTTSGTLVVIGPELVNGAPLRIILVPDAQIGGMQAHLLSNAYDSNLKTPWSRWFAEGLARYVDKQKFPGVLAPSGRRLSGVEQASRGTARILTEKQLAGYRKAQEQQGPLFSEAPPDAKAQELARLKALRAERLAARHGMAGGAYVPMYQGGQVVPMQAQAVTIGAGQTARTLPIPTTPIRREHILAQLMRDFAVKVYQGKPFRGRMLGFFRPSNFEVRVKHKNDLEVTAHEIFHWLDYTYPDLRRLYREKRFDRELRSISYDAKKLHEGFAEFGRLFLTQDAQAIARVPLFYAAFVQKAKELGLYDRLVKVQDRMHQWYMQGALLRAQSKIGVAAEPLEQRMRALADVFSDRAVAESVDRLHAGKVIERELTGTIATDAIDSPYKSLRLLAGGRNTIESFLNFGTLDWTPRGLEFSGKSLKHVFEPVAHVMDDAMSYFVGRRAQELMKYGKERLFTPDEIEALLAAGTQSPYAQDIEKAFDEYQLYVKRLMDFAESSGIVSRETRELWETMYQNYVPFYRVPETMGNTRVGGPGVSQPFKRLFGGTANVRDIWDNIVMNTAVVVQASLRNQAKQQLFAAIEKSPLGQRYAVRIATDTKSVEVGMTQVEQVLRSLIGDAEARARDPNATPADKMHYAQVRQALDVLTGATNAAGGAALDAMQSQATFYVGGQPPSIPDRDSVLIKGERVWFQIADPLLWDMLSDINYFKPVGLLEKVFGAFKRTLTRGVTLTPEFQIANLIRDTLNAFTMSKGGQIPFVHQLRAMADIWGRSEDYKLFLANGGGFGNATPAEEGKRLRVQLNRLVGPKGRINIRAILDTPHAVLDFWDRWGQSFELATRLAEFKRLKGKGASLREAAFEGREISSDFAMHGRSGVIRAAMISLPFTNARLQGLYRLERELFERGGRQSWRGERQVQYAMRGFLGITLPALLLYFLNKDDEDYRALPDEIRYRYYPIKLPDSHDFVLIPRPFETGAIFATIPEQIWDYEERRNPKKLVDAAAFMLTDTFAINPVPQIGRPSLEWYANKDWRGARIVPENLENVEAAEQFRWNTPESLVRVGKAFDVSPIALNHFLNGYFGGMASYVTMAADSLVTAQEYGDAPTKRLSEYPVARRFVREYPYPNTSYAREFWDLKKEIDRTVNTARKMRLEARGDDLEDYLGNREKEVLFGMGRLGERIADRARDISAAQISIRRDASLSAQEKREQIDALQSELNGLFKEVVQTLSTEDIERYRDALEGKRMSITPADKLQQLEKLIFGQPRRTQITELRANGYPATADLVASLPPTPDKAALAIFQAEDDGGPP